MPNWCENLLKIHGEQEALLTFKTQAEAMYPENRFTALSLAAFYPEPAEYPKDEPDAWWHWRIKHWGTKWDVEAVLYSESSSHLEYKFDSPWSPPLGWIQKVAIDYPLLTFQLDYIEPGEWFCGTFKAQQGEITDDRYDERAYMIKYADQFGFGEIYREEEAEEEAK